MLRVCLSLQTASHRFLLLCLYQNNNANQTFQKTGEFDWHQPYSLPYIDQGQQAVTKSTSIFVTYYRFKLMQRTQFSLVLGLGSPVSFMLILSSSKAIQSALKKLRHLPHSSWLGVDKEASNSIKGMYMPSSFSILIFYMFLPSYKCSFPLPSQKESEQHALLSEDEVGVEEEIKKRVGVLL